MHLKPYIYYLALMKCLLYSGIEQSYQGSYAMPKRHGVNMGGMVTDLITRSHIKCSSFIDMDEGRSTLTIVS